jgi:phytanoyl-CoA hydroxylase
MLSKAEIASYHENGFLVVEKLYDESIIQRMRAVTDEIVEKSRKVSQHTDVYDLDPAHTPEWPRVRRIKLPHKVDPVFMEAIKYPKLIVILQQLLGPGVRLKSSKLNLKEAEGGAPVEWHQDWAFYPHTNQDVLAVGVMLDDCQLENGPLLILPGSHKGPVYDHHADGFFCGAMDPSRCGTDFSKAVPCLGPAGSISIHHARAVHGSADNVSPYPRRLLLYELTAVDAWPLIGVPNLDEFNSRILVGKPTIEPRMENVPVRMPLPPAPNQGSIYENQAALKNRFFGQGTTAQAM